MRMDRFSLSNILFEAPGIEILLQEPCTHGQADIVYVQNSLFHNHMADENLCNCCSTTGKLESFSTSSVNITSFQLLTLAVNTYLNSNFNDAENQVGKCPHFHIKLIAGQEIIWKKIQM